MAPAQQKECVSCKQMLPLTAVNCVFCGATQPTTVVEPKAAPAPSSGPTKAPSLSGFQQVSTSERHASASPVIGGAEPSEHKATMLGIPAAEIQAAVDRSGTGSAGSASYSVAGSGSPDDPLAKTVMGSPGMAVTVAEGPVAGGELDLDDAKTLAMDSSPVAGKGVIVGDVEAPPADDMAKTVIGGPSVEDLELMKAAIAAERKKQEGAAEPANLVGDPSAPPDAAPADPGPTEHDMKVSEVDERLKKASAAEADAAPAEAAAQEAKEKADGEILQGHEAMQDAVKHAGEGKAVKGGEVGVAVRPTRQPRGKTLARLGAIFGGLLLLGFFAMPAFDSDMEIIAFSWETLDFETPLTLVGQLIFPVAGLLALLFGLIPVSQGARGLILAFLGAAAVGVTVANNAGGAYLFLMAIPGGEGIAMLTGILLLAGLVIEPAGLFARSAATESTFARILAILGALLILASYLAPVSGDLPVLGIIEGIGDAPAVAILILVPAVLALGFVTVFANPSSTGGAGFIGALFVLWALAAGPVGFMATAEEIDIGVLLVVLRNAIPQTIALFFLTYGLGQMFAKNTGTEQKHKEKPKAEAKPAAAAAAT